jgi:assimilatory nitrate reductase electron transfer subunit
VVLVGYGMAGARIAERIRLRDPLGLRVAVTAVGEEKRLPYNRVLLAGVVDGTLAPETVALQGADWAVENSVDLRLGVCATALDRAAGSVRLSDGSAADYDVAVLATGARPRIPPVEGLLGADGEPAPGVVAFRTLDDCERIDHATRAGAPVVVLGGGLLGLEAACALAARGNPVTIVHPVGHLMERQLDVGAGGVLARVLAGLGIDVRVGVTAARYVPGRGLELVGGELVRADCVVVSTGVRPETTLAERAGLAVDRGVLVDDELRTSDPRVHAVGDCARHPGTASGQVQSAWEQAAVLADLLTGADTAARYRGTRAVSRLKARAVDLTTVGDVAAGSPDAEVDADTDVVCLTEPGRGRYVKLVVRRDRVAGAIVLGVPGGAAAVTQLYDRDLPVPTDRLTLLLGRGEPATAAADLPAEQVVCHCNAVTKAALVSAWHDGAGGVAGLRTRTRATGGCGGCADVVGRIADWLAGAGR